MTTVLCRVVVGALLSVAWLGNAPAWAQLTISPEALSVDISQHQTETRTLTLTNTGSAALTFCVNFDRPLQREGAGLRLSDQAGGAPCGEYGEVLYRYDEGDFGAGWDPSTITMTPEGRLFIAELGGLRRTHEFTPELVLLRSFEHPHVAELTPFSGTVGIGYDTENGTMWWMNVEVEAVSGEIVTRRVLVLEGDLDGVETGRRIEIIPPDDPIEAFSPGGLAYDPATHLFYFSAFLGADDEPENWKLWAVDRSGVAPEGYPVRPECYPDGIFNAIDAHGGAVGGAEGVRFEYGAYPPGAQGFDRIVVVDRWGDSEGEALETPVPAVLFEGDGAGIRGNPLRSRTDPNGVMYMTFNNFDHTGIVGVRPHPLPPSWLVVDSDAGPEAAWDGELAPGESRMIELTFRAGARAVGEYTSALQAFDAATGEAVVVPLALAVTQGTDAESEPTAPEASSLAVYPNPSAGRATVVLMLVKAADVRVAVYDVLGRETAVLHDGRLGAGTHELSLDGTTLPAGIYVVRATGEGLGVTRRMSMVR